MKKTSKEFMEWLGLKVGDRVEFDNDDYKIVLDNDNEPMLQNEGMCFEIKELLDREIKILPQHKKVGDLKCCNEIKCEQCPIRGICTTMMSFPPMKLYDILNRYGVHKNTYFDQEVYDIMKTRLDKEIKE